jgi:hypothetical protein
MHHRWAPVALVLVLCAMSPRPAWGQQTAPAGGRRFASLGQNYPNPFKPETFIPFTVDDCDVNGGQRVVTLHVYNVLAQLVATPVLHGAGTPLSGVKLSCGEYLAHWDAKGPNGQRVASGVYLYELVVDGQRTSKKMFVSK